MLSLAFGMGPKLLQAAVLIGAERDGGAGRFGNQRVHLSLHSDRRGRLPPRLMRGPVHAGGQLGLLIHLNPAYVCIHLYIACRRAPECAS